MSERSSLSRRRLLAGLAMGTAAVAGCQSDGGGGSGGDTGDASGAGDSGAGTGGSGESGSPTGTPDGELLPTPVKGDAEASVTLAVFEDFACPHCADYNVNGLPDLESQYIEPGEIRYEHRDLPIPVADPGSWQAASAAREVQARHGDDAFWQFAAGLFENYGEIRGDVRPLFERLASDIGLSSPGEIATAGVERAHDATVKADRQKAIQLGLNGTPSFVVDGEVVTSGYGDSTIDTVSAAIEDAK